MRSRRTVAVYIDGFALYKALLQYKYPQYKWLDLEALSRWLFPHRDVVRVKYFSAQLKPRTNDPGIGQRQQIFWRALRTTGVEIFEGKFSFVKQRLPLHPEQLDANGKVITTLIKRPEEKALTSRSRPISSSTHSMGSLTRMPSSPMTQISRRRWRC